jgi:ATP-dependent helicase/nuclease subunit A
MTPRFIIPADTVRLQHEASDPAASVWVAANAGAGKTHVLVQRVIRLLLQGAHPARILCLTYTKAAAANMANRVFQDLGRWAVLDDEALAGAVTGLLGARPDADTLEAARQLFARALETPGGLKIQTIHAFCEAVLHQFPLEANIPGHFGLLDGAGERGLIAEARRALLAEAARGEDRALSGAFSAILAESGEAGLDTLLAEIVANRGPLSDFVAEMRRKQPPFGALYRAFGLSPDEGPVEIAASVWPDRYFDRALAEAVGARAKASGKTKAWEFAQSLLAACRTDDPLERLDCLRRAFLKTSAPQEAKSVRHILSKGVGEYFAGFEEEFERFAAGLLACHERIVLLASVNMTVSALRLAERLIARYEELKAARGLLDFNDLIRRTIRLLLRTDAGAWVQYRLDRGIDHILIDEAQDTSPDQWTVIRALADEFFAGRGARENAGRTIFAVGDEKQSIYSFQGAEPAAFEEARRHYDSRTRAAGYSFRRLKFHRSFRSVPDVLEAVDRVFSSPEARKGLSQEDEEIRHDTIRDLAPGCVELWPSLGREAVEEPEDWTQPVDHASAPSVKLAEAIAGLVDSWLASGAVLEDSGEQIRAGDIMVLVRKRDSFVNALSRALKKRQIAVAGADRLNLMDHIAVKDLVALGRILVQPADDLSLAALLRSPLFGLSEEALFDLASARKPGETLLSRLSLAGADAGIAEQIAAWRALAGRLSVFDFYATILARDGLRHRFLQRLGHEAGEVLDEFLNHCLAVEQTGLPGLDAFLAAIESDAPEIKREMDQGRDEVRIMTVHAAKGLEAPIVFLVDPGSAPFVHQHMPRLMPFEPPQGAWRGKGFLWRTTGERTSQAGREIGVRIAEKGAEEYRRLLYVGMTRAKDRLIVCGYHGLKDRRTDTWHAMVTRALESAPETETLQADPPFERILRFRVTPPRAALPTEAAPRPAMPPALPAALSRPLPPWPGLPRPLAPSRLGALIEPGADDAAISHSPVLEQGREPRRAVERGVAVHRLLQMLPHLTETERGAAMRRYLEHAGAEWGEAERQDVAASVSAILQDPAFAPAFAPGSRAEVAVTGRVMVAGEWRPVAGQIDRLAVAGDEAMIVDYKTSRPPPAVLGEVPASHIAQMALYDALIRQLYPDRRLRTALLYTETPVLIELPGQLLAESLARLAEA